LASGDAGYFAPGVSIYSANATGDTDYTMRTGTSMAAPHVAGAWAILRQSAPTATVSDIENAMKNSGVTVDSNCDTERASGPRLDVAAALDHFLPTPIPTLSEWTLLLFGLLLLGSTLFVLRKCPQSARKVLKPKNERGTSGCGN
jgi:subtilisin family serine protease